MLNIPSSILSVSLCITAVLAATLSQQHLLHPPTNPLPQLSRDFLGNSPLKYCNESRPTDLFWIDKIHLRPEKLYIDDIFTVEMRGYFTTPILPNSTWTSTARYGNSTDSEIWTQPFCRLITVIEQDPSNQSEERRTKRQNQRGVWNDRESESGCPPKRGLAIVRMEGWVWDMFIVPGDYFFNFDALNGDGRRIYCLETNLRLDYRDEKHHSFELRNLH
ncbi:MAG: hypothetical protein HETSPECPRED_010016 [Heterodermia speciosa]|uniref:Uncharacterized protein n=1 Tax=Heterodermia speciosa TaxID=116794 RepID=A0A8H3GAN3_9LECA|nr:MAG: hypothetical protein HETSPECPRED_010016 [Heterodermia speciosa]